MREDQKQKLKQVGGTLLLIGISLGAMILYQNLKVAETTKARLDTELRLRKFLAQNMAEMKKPHSEDDFGMFRLTMLEDMGNGKSRVSTTYGWVKHNDASRERIGSGNVIQYRNELNDRSDYPGILLIVDGKGNIIGALDNKNQPYDDPEKALTDFVSKVSSFPGNFGKSMSNLVTKAINKGKDAPATAVENSRGLRDGP